MLTAVCCAEFAHTRTGFANFTLAKDFVRDQLCFWCKHDLTEGFAWEDGEKVKISTLFDTDCGKKWLIVKDAEWITFLTEPKELSYLLECAAALKEGELV